MGARRQLQIKAAGVGRSTLYGAVGAAAVPGRLIPNRHAEAAEGGEEEEEEGGEKHPRAGEDDGSPVARGRGAAARALDFTSLVAGACAVPFCTYIAVSTWKTG